MDDASNIRAVIVTRSSDAPLNGPVLDSIPTPSGGVRLAIGKGHQGITGTAYGTFRFNKAENKPELVDIVRYPAECVNPPADVDSVAWLEGGMKGAKC